MTKMPALAALSVLLLNCHSPAPKMPEPVAAPAAAAAPAAVPVAPPAPETGTEAEPEPEPAPETAPETGTATVPATRTAPPAHDPARCTMATRAYPAWCHQVDKTRVTPKPAKGTP